jgi:NADH:ubiquinone oxidoreductase subunit 5 (subunit L)/multisubunit Na+/H+ antiporter MnhA subunit
MVGLVFAASIQVKGSLRVLLTVLLMFSPLAVWGYGIDTLGCSGLSAEVSWIVVGVIRISLGVCLESWVIVLLVLLVTLSWVSQVYGMWYMTRDSFFTGSVVVLLLDEDMILVFLGWVVLGIRVKAWKGWW